MTEQRSGKDITDPADGKSEVRGGEKPDDWTGPLPKKPKPVATPPGTAVTIAPGSDTEISDLDT